MNVKVDKVVMTDPDAPTINGQKALKTVLVATKDFDTGDEIYKVGHNNIFFSFCIDLTVYNRKIRLLQLWTQISRWAFINAGRRARSDFIP